MPKRKKEVLKRRPDGRYRTYLDGIAFYGRTSDEAIAAREEYRQRKTLGLELGTVTVREFSQKWLPIAKHGVEKNTYRYYELAMNVLNDKLGDCLLRDVTPNMIASLMIQNYADSSSSQVKRSKGLYSSMFESAIEENLCSRNPVKSQIVKKIQGKKMGSHRSITDEERNLIETVNTDSEVYLVAMLMLYAGLRCEEAIAIDIDRDIDFEKGLVCPHSVWTLDGKKTVEKFKGKTDAALKRQIPLFSPLRTALDGKHGKVFDLGNPPNRVKWRNAWCRYLTKMNRHLNDGKPGGKAFSVRPYDLRHSFATWARDHGVEIHTLAGWMGHVDATMILGIYDHVTEKRISDEVQKIEKSIKNQR